MVRFFLYFFFITLSFLKKICIFNFWVDNILMLILFYGGYTIILYQPYFTFGQTFLSLLNNFVTWGYIGMLGYTFSKYSILQNGIHF